MKALTLRQPWASLIAIGAKTIETRSWSTNHRGPLAIHAGRVPPLGSDMATLVGEQPGVFARWVEAGLVSHDGLEDRLPLGAVVAIATLADVLPMADEGSMIVDYVGIDLSPTNDRPPLLLWKEDEDDHVIGTDVSDQLPFGEFAPGRFAWVLEDVEPLDVPISATGKQGLWTWDWDAAGF